jgi:dihydroorotate dehydrogenase (fumarate)
MDLDTRYMGLQLKNPIIASSSTLTGSLEGMKNLEKAGVAAIVLKSLFEEEIVGEAGEVIHSGGGANIDQASREYINYYVKENSISQYLTLIEKAKKEIRIPIIASINCASAGQWIEFAKKIQGAGADALEVNVFVLPSRIGPDATDLEKLYFDVARRVSSSVTIPVALKLSSYFTNLASTFVRLSETGVKSLVLFSRFYSPYIDLSTFEISSSSVYSAPSDIAMPLRWIGILSGKVHCDLAATTGIHEGDGLVKVLLAGAKAAMIATTLYINGMGQVRVMLNRLEEWMKIHGFQTIDAVRGRLAQVRIGDPSLYERAQFMKYFSGHEPGGR